MQKYKEINGNDYVKDSRTTINETMQSIQSMNSGTAFPTNNLFEGMKCYRTDLKKTYTLTDVENNTWVEDAHATLSDEATHAASATKLQTARSLNLGGAVTADAATFDGTANATINVKTLDATKLKGTASVSTTGNAATATKVVTTAAAGASANIAEATMSSNDLARIRVSGETNAGELALETADNGSEPIVARQYTGVYTNAVRTAKILDESGNTSFPGTVVAPKFTGSLNGNAATATKLQTARTLSLTGKASGSTTFDGSANASINVTSVNADTANKLSTARRINITGNATGSTNFDGSGDVSISTTVNESKHAVNADVATHANDVNDATVNATASAISNSCTALASGVIDKLNAVTGSNDLTSTNKLRSYIGSLFNGDWYNVINIRHRNGATDGTNYGMLIYSGLTDTSSIRYRKQLHTEQWTEERTLLDSENYNSFAPTKTGGGASGTWGINISGNADTSTKASVADVVHKAIQPRGTYGNNSYIFYGTLTIPQNGDFFKLEVLGGYGHNSGIGQSREGTLYFRTGNGDPAHYAAYSEYHRNGAGGLEFFIVKDSGTKYRIYSNLTSFTGTMQVIPYVGQNSSFDLALTAVSALPDGAVEVEQQQLIYASTVNNYAPTKTGGGASGTWGINISGNAASATTATSATNATHASSADSATNADKVDGYHENSFLRYRGAAAANGEDTLWNQIGIKEYGGKLPKGVSGTYNYGAVVSLPAGGGPRLDIWYNHQCSANKDGLWYRSGYSTDQKAWARLLDSNNYTNWAPTKTGGGASGTWGINISGNAASATNADKLDGYHASDIINRISAANTGGIVAASLTENGYVKFANGLILQWGYGNAKAYVTFPIAFTSFARIMCTCNNSNWVWANNCSITGFSVWSDGGAFWFAVGV